MRRGTEIGNIRGRFIFQRAFFQVTRFLYQFLLLLLTLFPIRVNKLYQSIKVRRPRWCWRKRHETENDPNHRDICQVDRWSLPMIQQRQTSSPNKKEAYKMKISRARVKRDFGSVPTLDENQQHKQQVQILRVRYHLHGRISHSTQTDFVFRWRWGEEAEKRKCGNKNIDLNPYNIN